MPESDPFAPDAWCALDFVAQRVLLAGALRERLPEDCGVREVTIEAGPPGRPYDLTAVVETDVGPLRAPLWSHARARLFCDVSVHEANRALHGPADAVARAAARLRPRLAVPYELESRGLTFTLSVEEGVERTWTAEHSMFRKRTAVTREDRVSQAGELDVRDLLAHFYSGPSLRLVSRDGAAFLLPAAAEAEGPVVTLCQGCGSWSEGAHERCPRCRSEAADVVIAARAAGR
ncbi:MAG TPA: hypothetical protein VMN39_05385 [Longimicrobiaceae bacterium]|nr:hypothetical protein [Longimicrobiaceae bacterium]